MALNKTAEKIITNNLDVIILNLINSKPQHGYGLMNTIAKNYAVRLSPSTIYPLIGGLEKSGFVKAEWELGTKKGDRAKRVLSITDKGKQHIHVMNCETKLIMLPLLQNEVTI